MPRTSDKEDSVVIELFTGGSPVDLQTTKLTIKVKEYKRAYFSRSLGK